MSRPTDIALAILLGIAILAGTAANGSDHDMTTEALTALAVEDAQLAAVAAMEESK